MHRLRILFLMRPRSSQPLTVCWIDKVGPDIATVIGGYLSMRELVALMRTSKGLSAMCTLAFGQKMGGGMIGAAIFKVTMACLPPEDWTCAFRFSIETSMVLPMVALYKMGYVHVIENPAPDSCRDGVRPAVEDCESMLGHLIRLIERIQKVMFGEATTSRIGQGLCITRCNFANTLTSVFHGPISYEMATNPALVKELEAALWRIDRVRLNEEFYLRLRRNIEHLLNKTRTHTERARILIKAVFGYYHWE